MSNTRRSGGDEPRRSKKKKRNLRWVAYTFLVMLGLGLGALGMVGAYVYKAYKSLPAYQEFDPSLTSTIYDSKGRKVYELAAAENRTLVKIDDVPLDIQHALIATEDARFEKHFGVDVVRVFGAAWANVKYVLGMHNQLEGASTITMQLTRNSFLTTDQNMFRKVQEALIAVDLERRFTKKEILEKYLNQVPWGEQAHGIEAAAQTYFAKHAKDLTLSEGALLIGMLKGTSWYNPFDNYEGALNRRKVVLDQMVKYGYLDKARAEELKKEEPKVQRPEVTPTSVNFTGDWYTDYVISILTDNPPGTAAKYGTPVFDATDLYAKGLKITTALDLDAQKVVDEKIQKLIPAATKDYGSQWAVPQAAAVVMNHKTGYVMAITGGLQHDRMLGLNRATQSVRQPGSTIKPLVAYLPAIDQLGWGPGTVIDDSPPRLTYPDNKNVWPENYEFHYLGLKPMRYGLEQSINAMAVRALEAVGPKKAIEYARKAGLTSIRDASQGPQNDENLALALGGLTACCTPLELTSAYGTLGSMGKRVDPVIITKIENRFGEVIFQANPRVQQVLNADSTWLMVDIMKGSIIRGTASGEAKGFKGWPAAGKTGTTENWQDAWFVGFTPDIVTGVWTGYDNNEKQQTLPSGAIGRWTGAGPPTRVWTAIMTELVKEQPADWPKPNTIVEAQICRTSGLLPSPLCPKDDIVKEYFRKDFVPKQLDNVWTMQKVVRQPFIDPKTGKPVIDSVTKKPVEKYYLWREGCGTGETLLLIKRPTVYVRHPSDPWNFNRYWPADWWREAATEPCTPTTSPTPTPPAGDPGTTQPPVQPPPGNGNTQPPGNGTQPPGGGTQPPGGGTGGGGDNGGNVGGLLPPILKPVEPPGGGNG